MNMLKKCAGGHCPVCNCNTNQTQIGVMGQAKKLRVENAEHTGVKHIRGNG